jgi:ribosomal protein S17E
MKKVMFIGIIIFIIISGMACQRQDEKEKIKRVITGVQAAIEEKNIRAATGYIAKDYSDQQGNNFETLRGILLGYFFRYPKISGYITHLDISVDGASAQVTLKAILTSGQKTGSVTDVVPEQLGVYRFDVGFNKVSGDWKIISARRSQVNLQDQ